MSRALSAEEMLLGRRRRCPASGQGEGTSGKRTRYDMGVTQVETFMIKWAIIFAVVALVLAVLGFGGLAGAFIDIAKILFWLAVIIAVIFFVLGFTIYKKVT